MREKTHPEATEFEATSGETPSELRYEPPPGRTWHLWLFAIGFPSLVVATGVLALLKGDHLRLAAMVFVLLHIVATIRWSHRAAGPPVTFAITRDGLRGLPGHDEVLPWHRVAEICICTATLGWSRTTAIAVYDDEGNDYWPATHDSKTPLPARFLAAADGFGLVPDHVIISRWYLTRAGKGRRPQPRPFRNESRRTRLWRFLTRRGRTGDHTGARPAGRRRTVVPRSSG